MTVPVTMARWTAVLVAAGMAAGAAAAEPPEDGTGPQIRSARVEKAKDMAEQAQAEEAAAIRAVLTVQQEAWNRGDIDSFMEGYWKSEKLRFASGNTVTRGWQATLDRYHQRYESREKMGTLSFSDLDIRVLSDDAAMVFGRFTLKRAEDTPTGLFTLLFRKIGGRWVIVHDHTSSE